MSEVLIVGVLNVHLLEGCFAVFEATVLYAQPCPVKISDAIRTNALVKVVPQMSESVAHTRVPLFGVCEVIVVITDPFLSLVLRMLGSRVDDRCLVMIGKPVP